MTDPAPWYAWCFSHGRLHTFHPTSPDDDGAWCGAEWTRLNGDTEADAIADKTARYGNARFINELPLETQLAVNQETRL